MKGFEYHEFTVQLIGARSPGRVPKDGELREANGK